LQVAGSAKSNARIVAGECFCRAVGYAVADEFSYALNCHCSNCRRTTGAASMGTLADDPSIRPTAHIFVSSRASWFAITDDLPQYREHVVPR
jgi:hypothetical protein